MFQFYIIRSVLQCDNTNDSFIPIVTDISFLSTFSIGAQTGLDGKLSSHRSDYEIHSPEHRSIPKRPQSTAELVSVDLYAIAFHCKKFH